MTPSLVRAATLTVLALSASTSVPASASTPASAPGSTLPAPAPAARTALDPTLALPLDPAVRAGRLANGFSWFVRENRRPEKRAELWLVVDAGSVLEDDDQQGLAHFVEHMAFNGTRRFPKQELIRYLESIGMAFGPDVNASTSFDETVYTLRVPTDSPEAFGRAFEILEDWACCIRFDADEIDKERGVVVEEWRQGRGAGARIRDRQVPVLLAGSRYAERLTIGKKEILEQAPAEALRRFHRDWYRPDLMALVAVGDFDAADVVARVERAFGGLAAPVPPRPRPRFAVPSHREMLSSVVADPELQVGSASLIVKRDTPPQGTAGDYRRSLVEGLYATMLNERLRELQRQPDPPFLGAGISFSGFGRSTELRTLGAATRPDGIARGLQAAATEVERLRRFGFTATELERSKLDLLRAFESAFEERDQTESDSLAAELQRHFLEGEPVPGIARELDLVRQILPGITLEDVDRIARQGADGEIEGANRVLLVTLPETEGVAVPAIESLRSALAAAALSVVAPFQDRTSDQPLVPRPPEPASIVAESGDAALGIADWRLSNGVRVVLKPTDFKNDEVLLQGFRPGGHSLDADADFVSALYAGALVREGGAGEFDVVTLDKALAGKVASAGWSLGEIEERAAGFASPRDLETMFQLLYLRLTAPRRDDPAIDSFLQRSRAALENRAKSPAAVFADRMTEVLGAGHARRRPPSVALLAEIDRDAAFRVYRERFAHAGGFTFLVVGRFDLESIRPLVLRWLGGLPAAPAGAPPPTFRDVGARLPAGSVRFAVAKGIEPKASVELLLHGPAEFSREAVYDIQSLAEALRIRLRETLREDLGGVYGVTVQGSLVDRPRPEFRFRVGFGCDPRRVDELVAQAEAEMARFRDPGPDASVLQRVRETQRREREVALRENGFWASTLEFYLSRGLDPAAILRWDELQDRLTNERLRASAARYLDPTNTVRGQLLPEAPAPEPAAAGSSPASPATSGR